MKSILVRGILSGFVLFGWSTISHMPPLGTAGYRTVPAAQEEAVLQALRAAMTERAIHVVPAIASTPDTPPAERQARAAKYEAGPAAVVVYDPRPSARLLAGSLFGTLFAIELAASLVAGLLAALVMRGLSSALAYWPRVFVAALLGLIGTIDSDVGYWNWYAFPTSYLLAQFVDHGVGWFLAGLVLAGVRKPT